MMPITPFNTLDTEIIQILSRDGRTTNRAIGKLLNISPRQVANRIERLTSNDSLKIVALVDMHAAGYDLIVFIGIKTANRVSREIGETLSKFDEVTSILLMTGKYNIEMMVLAENHTALAQFVTEKLFSVSGIQSISVGLALQIEKFRFSWTPFVSKMVKGIEIGTNSRFDMVNRKIINLLWQDACLPFQVIANKLDISESNARNRIIQMKAMNYIQISGATNMNLHDTDILAFVEMKIEGSKSKKLIKQLAGIKNVVFISVMLGRCDILAMMIAKNLKQLSHSVTDIIEKLPGVLSVSASQRIESIKHDPRWTRISSHVP